MEQRKMSIKQVPVNEIRPLWCNPSNRTTAEGLSNLLPSIQRKGILQPIVINRNNELIDGHRRWTCAKLLGYDTVPCNVLDTDEVMHAYVELNGTARRIQPRDWLLIYLSGGEVPEKQMEKLTIVENYWPRWPSVDGREGHEPRHLQLCAHVGPLCQRYGVRGARDQVARRQRAAVHGPRRR